MKHVEITDAENPYWRFPHAYYKGRGAEVYTKCLENFLTHNFAKDNVLTCLNCEFKMYPFMYENRNLPRPIIPTCSEYLMETVLK